MNTALARLCLRRALPIGFTLGALALAVLVVALERSTRGELPGAGALARTGTWTTLSFVLLPFVLHRAARTVGEWRAGEIDWLAKAPTRRGTLLVSAWIGASAAGVLVVAGIALAAELAAGEAGPCERRVAACATPANVLLDDDQPRRWTIHAPARADCDTLRLYLAIVPIEPAADVELRARRALGGATLTRARIAARTTLDIATPPGAGPIELELRRVGGGAIVLLDRDRVDALATAPNARLASAVIAARTLLALGAWLALALGLGAWMSASFATSSALALALPAFLATDDARVVWSPWRAFGEALELGGRGVVAEWPTGAVVASAALFAFVGLALALWGTRTWRTSA